MRPFQVLCRFMYPPSRIRGRVLCWFWEGGGCILRVHKYVCISDAIVHNWCIVRVTLIFTFTVDQREFSSLTSLCLSLTAYSVCVGVCLLTVDVANIGGSFHGVSFLYM